MTVLEFLRAFKTSGAETTRYKKQTQIAVGIRHVSFSSDLFFGQSLSMNVLHCLPQELLTCYRQFTPPSLLYFASARKLALETWRNEAAMRKVLSRNGDARHYVDAWLEKLASDSFTIDCFGNSQLPIAQHVGLHLGEALSGAQWEPYTFAKNLNDRNLKRMT